METKKFLWVLFGILVISAWFFVFTNQVMAETLNFKSYTYGIKEEIIPIADMEGHELVFTVRRGFNVYENGEVAIIYNVSNIERVKGGMSLTGYSTLAFPDGATIIIRIQGTIGSGVPGSAVSGAIKSEIINGTGRFEGIKGTTSSKYKYLPPEKGEPGPKGIGAGTMNYTLPSK
jgi:hypothetical protein